jgi:hypothetical protein
LRSRRQEAPVGLKLDIRRKNPALNELLTIA